MELGDEEPQGTAAFLECNCLIDLDVDTGTETVVCPDLPPMTECPGIDDPGQEQKDLVGGPGTDPGISDLDAPEFVVAPDITQRPATEMDFLSYILNRAGALPHDKWDKKFLRDYRTGKGEMGAITDQGVQQDHSTIRSLVEGDPPPAGPMWPDADCDGIDDTWEAADPTGCYLSGPPGCCANPPVGCTQNDALEDCPNIGDPGYADLEAYLHLRALDLEQAVFFADEFEDREIPMAPDWTFSTGTWSEVGGYLEGLRDGDDEALAWASSFPCAPEAGAAEPECSSVAGTMQVMAHQGSTTDHVRLLGWVVDPAPATATYVAVSLLPAAGAAGQVVVERWNGGSLVFRCTAARPITAGTDYDVRMEYRPSATGSFDVYFNETTEEETFLTSCGPSQAPQSGAPGVAAFRADIRAGRLAATGSLP